MCRDTRLGEHGGPARYRSFIILAGESLGLSLNSMVTSQPPDRSDVPEKPRFPPPFSDGRIGGYFRIFTIHSFIRDPSSIHFKPLNITLPLEKIRAVPIFVL